MFTKVSIATFFASLAAAQIHPPVGEPTGNPISSPSLHELVPACKPFPITWTPTTPNTVSILLVKGPSSNVVKYGPALVEGLANSGTFSWTPAADLPASDGPEGYGLQLIDDVTGQYQWSVQFGISKDECAAVSSSSVVSASSTGSAYAASTPASSASKTYSASKTSSASESSAAASSSAYGTTVAPPKSTLIYSTGAPHGNTSAVQPTKPITVPSSLKPSATGNATTSRLPEATGAASALQAGLSIAGAAVAFALML